MNIGRRIQVQGPQRDLPWNHTWHGHACDEYGNCSVYAGIAALGILTIFWEPPSHFQRDTELPAPGTSPWIDKRYYS